MKEQPDFDDEGIDRKDFWSRVDRQLNGCWEWKGPRNAQGYGLYRPRPGQHPKLAHRIAFGLAFGTSPEAVCHTCDRASCVSPSHLVGADRKWNNRDAWAKGRARNGRTPGTSHHNARLSEDDVRAIRAKYAEGGVSQAELAKTYGTSKPAIQRIIARTRWKHLDAPGPSGSEDEK